MSSPSAFPTVLRELVRTHQTFLTYAAIHAHSLDLTLTQFDVILTLGNAFGMTFKRLGEKTLITKGTLTGVINRLEDKGLVQRIASKTDGRSQVVRLTVEGTAFFERVVPEHLGYVHRIFKDYSPENIATLEAALLQLRKAIFAARCDGGGKLADGTDGWCAKVNDVCKNYQDSHRVC